MSDASRCRARRLVPYRIAPPAEGAGSGFWTRNLWWRELGKARLDRGESSERGGVRQRELGAWGPRPILSVSTPVVLLSGVSILGTRKPRGIRSCAVDLACRELADIRILRADSASEAVSLELELVRDGKTSYETERARTRRRELVRAGKSSFEPGRARSEREELARA